MKIQIYLYITVFLCGAAVLVIELISARHMASFYGTSLAVWTGIISVTMAALALGYMLGGWMGDRLSSRFAVGGLGLLLALSSATCSILPVWGPAVMNSMQNAGVVAGALISASLMLTVPLATLGMVGPYAIRVLSTDVQHVGRVSGRVFALSTVGSILGAMLTGYYLAPGLGVRASCLAVGIVLAILSTFGLVQQFSLRWVLACLIAMIAAAIPTTRAIANRTTPKKLGEYTILEISEGGPSGEIKILEKGKGVDRERILMFDGLFQTTKNLHYNSSNYSYAHVMAAGLSVLPPRSKIVVVGLGGGVVPSLLAKMGYDVIGVDLDPRMPDLARRWFDMPESVKVVLEDGRQYLEKLAPGSVDAIVIDAFTGDREPVHLMTQETFAACKRAVKDTGLIVLNPLMYTRGERGRCYAGLIRTLQEADLQPLAVGTAPQEEWRNILVFCHPNKQPWIKGFRREPLLALGLDLGSMILRDYYVALQNPVEPEKFADTPIFTDDCTSLDYLNQGWNHGLRRVMIKDVSPPVLFF